MRSPIVCAAIGLTVMICGGCGGKVTKTPDGTVHAYMNLMKGGKYKDAAMLWDYETQARQENENWDDIAAGQRREIIGKLADEKAEALKQWSTHFASDLKVETVETTGDQARAIMNGRIGEIDLVKIGDQWLISQMK